MQSFIHTSYRSTMLIYIVPQRNHVVMCAFLSSPVRILNPHPSVSQFAASDDESENHSVVVQVMSQHIGRRQAFNWRCDNLQQHWHSRPTSGSKLSAKCDCAEIVACVLKQRARERVQSRRRQKAAFTFDFSADIEVDSAFVSRSAPHLFSYPGMGVSDAPLTPP